MFDYKVATMEELKNEIKRISAIIKTDKATLKAHNDANKYFTHDINRDDKAIILKSEIKRNTNAVKRYKERLAILKAQA